MIERECTCDSKYVLSAMRRVDEEMRLKYHWVTLSTMLYLVMDNLGGHGIDACVDEYHMLLLEQYNITIIQQVLRLLYINILDNGVWAGLQFAVEREYYMRRINQ